MKKCIVYLDRSLYDINVNMRRMLPYIDMMPTEEKHNALDGDIRRMRPTAIRLVSDISQLTSEYRAILQNKQMNPTLEDEMIKLNNRLMDIDRRKRDLFDNILKTLAKYHIQYTRQGPITEETNANTKEESSGGRRRKRTLRKKRALRKQRTMRTKRNRA